MAAFQAALAGLGGTLGGGEGGVLVTRGWGGETREGGGDQLTGADLHPVSILNDGREI